MGPGLVPLVVLSATVGGAGGCHPERASGVRLQAMHARSVEKGLARTVNAPMRAGNALTLIENGAVFDALERDILRAKQSVHIVTYIWRGEDGPSERIGRALLARKPGVACRIVIDSFGSLKFSDDLAKRLSASGCEIRRDGFPSGGRVLARTHRKILVVDGRSGITGGFGIWKAWEGNGRTEDEWRDTAVRVEGPVVTDMQHTFEQSWRDAGGAALPPEEYPRLGRAGDIPAAFVSSSPRRRRPSGAELMSHVLISSARRKLLIANSYFIPSKIMQDRLIERRRDGVDVRVLSPGPVHDVPPVRAAQRDTYERLLAGGVRIYEYQPSMMHAKTMVVDDRYVVIGSTNFDPLSFERLEEASLVADAPALARELGKNIEADLAVSDEITKSEWAKREILPEIGRDIAGLLSDWL